jgi:hypothetical protein
MKNDPGAAAAVTGPRRITLIQSTKAQASPTAQADIDATPSRKSWRQVLPIHPATELFPLLGADELRELAHDIEKHGLRESAALYNDPKLGPCLLDGRNRFDALELLGREIIGDGDPCPGIGLWNWVGNGGEPFDPVAFVLSKNIHRRHLTAEQRRELIVKLLKAKPEATNLQIAKQVKVDDKTVGKVRTELEGRSEIPNVKTRTDSKGRKQPAKKRTKAHAPTAEPETSSPRKTVAPGDEALFGFSACILELKRRVSTHQPTRFAGTAVAADELAKLGKFLTDLARVKASARAPRDGAVG